MTLPPSTARGTPSAARRGNESTPDCASADTEPTRGSTQERSEIGADPLSVSPVTRTHRKRSFPFDGSRRVCSKGTPRGANRCGSSRDKHSQRGAPERAWRDGRHSKQQGPQHAAAARTTIKPIVIPTAPSASPAPQTFPKSRSPVAPSAIRIPSSRRRCATLRASTPYSPRAASKIASAALPATTHARNSALFAERWTSCAPVATSISGKVMSMAPMASRSTRALGADPSGVRKTTARVAPRNAAAGPSEICS